MSRFNLHRKGRTGVSPVRTEESPSGRTFEGAPGHVRDARSELFLLAVTSMFGEDTCYESGTARDTRLRELAGRVAVDDPAWTLIRLGSGSVARDFVAPAQDLLSLGSEARMNFPGKPSGNWTWRLREGALAEPVAERLRELTATYDRLPA